VLTRNLPALGAALLLPALALSGCTGAPSTPEPDATPKPKLTDVCAAIPADRLGPLFGTTLTATSAGPIIRDAMTLYGCHYKGAAAVSIDISTAYVPDATAATDVLGELAEHEQPITDLGDAAVFSDVKPILYLKVAKHHGTHWFTAMLLVTYPTGSKVPTKSEATTVMRDVTTNL
jgi:hypothetical protein